MEQEYGRCGWPLLHDTLLYALGGRGAMGALHGINLPVSRQRLTMVLLALGWLQADDTSEYIPDTLTYDEQFQQKVAQVISTHFGLTPQESLHAVTSFSTDQLDLMPLSEPGQSEELDRSMAHEREHAAIGRRRQAGLTRKEQLLMVQSRTNKGVKSLMNLFKATTTFLEDIHDRAKRTTSSSMLEGVLLESKRTLEERKQAADFLLQAVQEETDQERMTVIYSVLATVATYSDVEGGSAPAQAVGGGFPGGT
jgi:hypothetical protein